MADVSDLPVVHHNDAGYSPQYVKLAQALRCKTESGQYRQDDIPPAAGLAREYKVPLRVTYCALAILAATRYVSRLGAVASCSVTWQAGT